MKVGPKRNGPAALAMERENCSFVEQKYLLKEWECLPFNLFGSNIYPPEARDLSIREIDAS